MTRKTWRIGRGGGALALALGLALTAPAARAQLMGGAAGPGDVLAGSKGPLGSKSAPTTHAAPSALPGASPAQKVAPSEVSPSSMNPTSALFDAINRDDVAAARDALNRGAELQGHNVLGMTPLQLSIDLGRNDITFLLLSMHAGEGGAAPPPAGPSGPGGMLAGKTASSAPARQAAPARSRPARAPVVARSAPPAAPARVAGNGGTPVPSAGFLGFDPTR